MTTVTALVADLQARGVILEHRADKLVVRPASKLTPVELEALRQHKAAVLALLRPSRAGTAAYAFPWPDMIPGLGPRRVLAFDLCECGIGTWVVYGTRALCLPCARRRTEPAP